MPNNKDVFQTRTQFGGGFNAHDVKLTFPQVQLPDDEGDFGLSIEQLQFNYQQQIQRVWDITGDGARLHLVAGHPVGQAQMQRIVGPSRVISAFFKRYGDACRANSNNVNLEANTHCVSRGGERNTHGRIRVKLKRCILEGVGLQITAENPVIRQSLQMQFAFLEWSEPAA